MFSTKFTFTLVSYIAITLILASTTEAAMDIQRRDHTNLNRMIRKRADRGAFNGVTGSGGTPVGVGGGPGGGGADPVSGSATPTASTSSAAPSSTPSAASTSSAAPTSSTPSTSQAPVSSTTTTTTSSTSSVTTPAVSSVALGKNSQVVPTTTPTPSVSISVPNGAAVGSPDVVVVTSTTTRPTPTNTAAPPQGAASLPHMVTTIFIVIGASIAGIALLWTVIRKWKLRPSSKFDDRMQPIDWTPSGSEDGHAAIVGNRRPLSRASSFHSSAAHGNDMFAPGAHLGQPDMGPLPQHDFTAPASHLAPVGGYADLARGPSPGPQMQEYNYGATYNQGYNHGQGY